MGFPSPSLVLDLSWALGGKKSSFLLLRRGRRAGQRQVGVSGPPPSSAQRPAPNTADLTLLFVWFLFLPCGFLFFLSLLITGVLEND